MNNNASLPHFTYRYTFIFDDGRKKAFDITLDKNTLNLVSQQVNSPPQWAALSLHKCPGCPLDERNNKFCPVASHIAEVIHIFKDSISYEEAEVIIDTQERKYTQRVAMQQGISSLLGIYMVVSGCPLMDKLKPMVRFHLPFATIEETSYRALSMYLLAQYFLYKHGNTPDWDLQKLSQTYEAIRQVNKNMCERLKTIEIQDASLNAIVNLDVFATCVNFSIAGSMIGELEQLFTSYFKG